MRIPVLCTLANNASVSGQTARCAPECMKKLGDNGPTQPRGISHLYIAEGTAGMRSEGEDVRARQIDPSSGTWGKDSLRGMEKQPGNPTQSRAGASISPAEGA